MSRGLGDVYKRQTLYIVNSAKRDWQSSEKSLKCTLTGKDKGVANTLIFKYTICGAAGMQKWSGKVLKVPGLN